jgi:hypothetical protein
MNRRSRTLLVAIATITVIGLAVGLSGCSDSTSDGGTTGVSATPGGDGPGTTQGMPAPGEPLSVEAALAAAAADDSQPFLVTSYLFVYADGTAILCDAILESYPPQPGGATLTVEGLDPSRYPLATEGDVSWTDAQVHVLGTIDASTGVMTASDTSL